MASPHSGHLSFRAMVFFVVKVAADDGAVKWAWGLNDYGKASRSVAVDAYDNVYIAGQFRNTTNLGGDNILTSHGEEERLCCQADYHNVGGRGN